MRRGKATVVCTQHYHSPCPLSIHRHHRREPTPTASLPVVPGSILLPRIRRDGNLAESFAIYDGGERAATRAHLPRFIREQDEQRYLPVSLDNDITDTASVCIRERARREGKGREGRERASERERWCRISKWPCNNNDRYY